MKKKILTDSEQKEVDYFTNRLVNLLMRQVEEVSQSEVKKGDNNTKS